MAKVLWDAEDDIPARGYDGSKTIIKDGIVLIKELYCNCGSPGCGGCVDVFSEYHIGSGRYYYKEVEND